MKTLVRTRFLFGALALVLFSLNFSACDLFGDDGKDNKDTTKVDTVASCPVPSAGKTLEFITPKKGAIVHIGDTVKVKWSYEVQRYYGHTVTVSYDGGNNWSTPISTVEEPDNFPTTTYACDSTTWVVGLAEENFGPHSDVYIRVVSYEDSDYWGISEKFSIAE